MSLRPPCTPRAASSVMGAPGSTPTATNRRKSLLPSSIARPASHSDTTPESMDSLREAMKKHDPAKYTSPSLNDAGRADSPSPIKGGAGDELRRKMMKKPSLANVRNGVSALARPSTPTSGTNYRSTSSAGQYARPQTPTNPFNSSTASRFAGPHSNQPHRDKRGNELEVGDEITLDVGGVQMEGVMRFLGPVEGKDGVWGGVELDLEWQGRGKNDGTVKGIQYFACPPLSGLFVPLTKLLAKNASPSFLARSVSRSSSRAASNILLTSRAANTLGLTPQDLAAKRVASANLSQSTMGTPTHSARPKSRPTSPEKLGLSASTNGVSTPRAPIRSRPSLGGAFLPPPSRTPRKSIGGATPVRPTMATPRSNSNGGLGASVSRSLAHSVSHNSGLPEVPPIPSGFGGRRSITPNTFRAPATPGRRMSTAHSTTNESVRSATPSVRSFSRQSFASSSHSRHSAFGDDATTEDVRALQEELRDACEREGEVRKMFEGSERVGRDMEEKLGGKEAELKSLREKNAMLEREREMGRRKEEVRIAGVDGEEGLRENERIRVRELEESIEAAARAHQISIAAAEKLAREQETKIAQRQAELDSTRERMLDASTLAAEERARLDAELETLRVAGQSLCVVYEEQISRLDMERIEAIEIAEQLTERLATLDTSGSRPTSPGSPSTRLSVSTNTAEAIDAENAAAEVVHLKAKIEVLEEQLDEIRAHLESELSDTTKRRAKSVETEAGFKKELKALKDAVEHHQLAELKAIGRSEDIEEALLESQIALENERAEVERLRSDAGSNAALANLTDELHKAKKQIVALELAERTASERYEKGRRESVRDRDTIEGLQHELKLAHEKVARLKSTVEGSRSAAVSKPATLTPVVESRKAVATSVQEDCEMCGKNDHELEDCPDFGAPMPPPASTTRSPVKAAPPPSSSAEYCDDCEEYGHSLEDCPLQTF